MAAAVKTVADVLARLEAIDAALPPSDGVKWFNKLYLEVTQRVEKAVPAGHQAAPGFLAALDVVFAERYFDAFDAAGNGAKLPAGYPFHAWKPLFEARFATGVAPVQFALAGMKRTHQPRPLDRRLRGVRRARDRAERRRARTRGL
jgi:hypothetical protein